MSALEKSEDGGGGGVKGAQAESQGAPQLEGGERGGETTDQSINSNFDSSEILVKCIIYKLDPLKNKVHDQDNLRHEK